MEESLFKEWLQKYFSGITVEVVEELNGENRGPQTYLHITELEPLFSVTGKWETVLNSFTTVSADVVAMDSPLPLKKRDRLSGASGDIPKKGMHMQLNENQLTELDTLIATGVPDSVIIQRIFADTPRCIIGIYERNELEYLYGASRGVALVTDIENTGAGVRLDYGYPEENKFGVDTLWTDPASKPFDDIKRVLDKARLDGNVIRRVKIDPDTLANIAATEQAKQLYAFQAGFIGGDLSNVPSPDTDQLNAVITRRFGFAFQLIDRSIRVQKNDVFTAIKPWKPGNLLFQTGTQMGNLVYARLAEQNHPVAGVAYSTPATYILVSKFRQNQPSLSEHTTSQARVFPVINNANALYLLESTVLEG